VRLASGRSIRATAQHRLYGATGWVRVGHLRPGDRLALARRVPEPARQLRWDDSRLALLVHSDEPRSRPNDDLFWDRVTEVRSAGTEDVFDLTVPSHGSWLADGIVSHNSGAIEQDADVVFLLFREEYYKPDKLDIQGLAEVNIAKQRNGPTGRVELVFIREYARFENPDMSGAPLP
jgi:replicative DNA helicase